MSSAHADPFEQMIRDAGEAYLVDWYAPKSDALPHLRAVLLRADALARQRFGGDAPRLTPEHLVEAYRHNPHKVKALLQVLSSVSPEMLVMAWRVLQGVEITAIEMHYAAGKTFSLRIALPSPDLGPTPDVYTSTLIEDAAVLRHLGIMRMDEKPLFDGFYALDQSRA